MCLLENKYLCSDLFKTNVITIIIKNEINNNKSVSSSYLFESCDIWHDKLRYMN